MIKRGGARPGSGRKAGVKTSRHHVYLDDASVERALELGEGNLSAGVRKALSGGEMKSIAKSGGGEKKITTAKRPKKITVGRPHGRGK